MFFYRWNGLEFQPRDSKRLYSPAQVTKDTAPFLDAICQSPEADEPRLIYCDWLEHQGYTAWAAYIRTHVQMNDTVGSDYLTRADQKVLSDLCKEIIKLEFPSLYQEWLSQEAEWSRRLADVPRGMEICVSLEGGARAYMSGGHIPEPPWTDAVVNIMKHELPSSEPVGWSPLRRGFIGELTASESFLIQHGRDLVRYLPLEKLHISWQNCSTELFQQRELLQHIKSIGYASGGDHVAMALAQSKTCSNLRSFRLFGDSLTDQGVLALAQSTSLGSITQIDLGTNKFSAEAGMALQSRHLRGFGKTYCNVRMDSCNVESPQVSYPGSYLGVWGVKDLCAKWNYIVTEVKINRHRIGDEGLAVLVHQPWMESITWIEVMDDEIGVSGIHSLTQSPYLRNLKVLVLHRNPISDEGIKVLAQASNLPGLQRLGCRTCKLTDNSVEYFLGSSLPKLRAINMGDNPISPDGYARLKPRFGDCVNYTPPKD